MKNDIYGSMVQIWREKNVGVVDVKLPVVHELKVRHVKNGYDLS